MATTTLSASSIGMTDSSWGKVIEPMHPPSLRAIITHVLNLNFPEEQSSVKCEAQELPGELIET